MPDVSDQKANVEHASSIDDAYRDPSKPSATGSPNAPNVVLEARRRGLQPPAIIARLTPDERSELELRLRKKIDLRLLPMIILMYIMNYIDRNNIAAAKLANLEKDLGLPTGSTEYQTSVSILFVGYLLMQIPSNLFLNKIGKPAIYLPTCPGCLYFLSCWYTRKELGLRTAMLYSGALISGAFSGLISAGITANMNGARGIAAWRWLFIIEGVATIGIAFIAYFILPNFPRTTSWLSEEEKALAIWRLEEDIGEDDWIDSQHQTFWSGAKSAFSDVKTYVLMVLLFCIVASGTVTNFFPTVVATLGYNSVNSLLLTAPPYVLCVITSFANAWHADRTGERYWHIILPLILNMVANIIAATTTSLAPRYLSMMLMVPGVYTGYVVALAWISNTLPRPPAKRAAGLAFINAVSNTSSIYASYMYPNSAGPRYIVAMSVNCCTSFIAICAATVLRFMLVRLNKKLDRGIHVEGAINALPGEAAQHGFRFKI
ncbi:pantothenate transporter liz1 [Seiridium cupressi]